MPPRGPRVAADVIIQLPSERIVLVRRRNPPPGWAIPGGFIDEGESAEVAAIREAREETGLDVELTELFNVYSEPGRDPRHHTLSVIFLGRAEGEPIGGDDAAEARAFSASEIPAALAFDHSLVLRDYFAYLDHAQRPLPRPATARRFSEGDRAYLLGLARSTIRSTLEGRAPVIDPPLAALLHAPGAAFVSLHRDGALRGCIGTLSRDRPLYKVVSEMALAAAFEDPRFSPLTASELDALHIEISILSEPRRVEPATIVPGLHGVSVALHGCKGLFLPQVAGEAHWDRETLLAQTCAKAGLAGDAWKNPDAEVYAFTAEIFGETP